MKKLFTLLFVAGIAAGAFATTEKLTVQIRQTEPTKVAIAFNEVPQGTVTIKISDQNDRVILRDRVNSPEAFAKKYDLNALPAGVYDVEVLDETGVVRTASVDTNVAVAPVVYSRVVKIDNNKYRLLVSNLDAKEVEVLIYDGDHLIHSEVIDNPQGLHKIYTVDKPGVGDINFRIKTASGFESFVSSL